MNLKKSAGPLTASGSFTRNNTTPTVWKLTHIRSLLVQNITPTTRTLQGKDYSNILTMFMQGKTMDILVHG